MYRERDCRDVWSSFVIADDLQRSPVSVNLQAGERRLVSLQRGDGSWEAEVIWSPVITAQAVIVQAIAGQIWTDERRRLMLHYFRRNTRPDGGWGLHAESRSYVFVTTLVYIAARLLGAPPDDDMLVSGRRFLARQPGGVLANPQWGRFWLALMGLYDQKDLNPCPPELFLLPRGSPLSPLRFYCHTRYIYLAMAYLSGTGFRADLDPLGAQLREELPGLDHRGREAYATPVAANDLHEAPGRVLETLYSVTRRAGPVWHRLPGSGALRKRALAQGLKRIRYEQRATRYQGLSPVSGLLNTLALLAHDPKDPDIQASLEGVESWCWSDEVDGLRYAGARSTAWDTSFALQALVEGGLSSAERNRAAIRQGYERLCAMQATGELPDRIAQDRDINLGGWCFTEGAQAWPVSDCTAEAVVALIDCHATGIVEPQDRIAPVRLKQAAEFILSRQNQDGGFGSYERRRGQGFLEKLNPSEMFGRCMTELSYVECTSSSIRALRRILDAEVPVDRHRLEDAIQRGTEIILSRQQADGSWPGFWGINFIYGTLFALTALRDIGLSNDHPAMTRARSWLETRQKADGGWGEHFNGCATGIYVDNSKSLVISTAWAILALLSTTETSLSSAERGGVWLREHQLADGDWPRDSVNGVFFGTAMLDYRLYNTYFPVMALAKLARHAGA